MNFAEGVIVILGILMVILYSCLASKMSGLAVAGSRIDKLRTTIEHFEYRDMCREMINNK